jgi:hypothetical protein
MEIKASSANSIAIFGTWPLRTCPIVEVEEGFDSEKKFLLQQNPELAKVFRNVQQALFPKI